MILPKRRKAAWLSVALLLVGFAWGVYRVWDGGDAQLAWVEVPARLARPLFALLAVWTAMFLVRRLGSLLPGAPAVIITDAGIRSYASDRWFPLHPFAAWDEIVGVRLGRRIMGIDRIVLELRDRRPIKIHLHWLSHADATRLRQELSARLIGRGPSPDWATG